MAFEKKIHEDEVPEPKGVDPKPVASLFAAPGVILTSRLNGKQMGKWQLRNHLGKIVHSCELQSEIIRLYKVWAVNAEASEENNYDGRGWDILPHDPRKAADPKILAKQAAIQRAKEKRAKELE